MILTEVLGRVCYKQGKINMLRCTDAHARAHTPSLPNKHTPPRADFSSSCSFLLGTLKPVHVSPCPSLSRLAPPTPLTTTPPMSPTQPPAPLLFHFMCSLPPFHNPLSASKPSFHRVTYQIFHHVTANKVKYGARFFSLHLFLPPAPVASHEQLFFLSPACNLAVTPDPFFNSTFAPVKHFSRHLSYHLKR